jgi:hypothetical protein
MKPLIEYTRDLLQLKRGPQDLPYSPGLTAALFLAAVVADLILDVGVLHEPRALLRVAVADGLMLVLPYLALAVAGRESRYLQTLAAICILSIVFAALLTPVLMLQPTDPKAAVTAVQSLSAFVGLGLVSWQVLVQGHILRHALETSLAVGVLVAVGFFAVSVAIGSYLFPQVQP